MSMAVTSGSSGTETHGYTYDAIYQVTAVDYPAGYDPDLATDTTYAYDEAGNRTSVIDAGGTSSYVTNALNQYTAVGAAAYDYDDNGNMTQDDRCQYAYDPENRLVGVASLAGTPGPLTAACDSTLVFTTGGGAEWFAQTAEFHDGGDAAQSGAVGDDGETWMETTVEGPGTLTFWWKVSCDVGDYLILRVDGAYVRSITGSQSWQSPPAVNIYGEGPHTIRWTYDKDGGGEGADCGWVDNVRWSGSLPGGGVQAIEYTYDPSGRRIEKKEGGQTQVKYVHDGDHVIAEYDGSNNLLRKYVHGPCIDEPICLIEESGGYEGTYYYHYDALGSVVALTNDAGTAVQFYDYSVWGQVSAWDNNHPNRFMFTGREFDKDTGLYYYRARYYNPEIGRFLQTDPIGYGDGMNWYAYCGNNPLAYVDPSGCSYFTMSEITEGPDAGNLIRFYVWDDLGNELMHYDACGVGDGCKWLSGLDDVFSDEWLSEQIGWRLAGRDRLTFWHLKAIEQLGAGINYARLEEYGVTITREPWVNACESTSDPHAHYVDRSITWSTNIHWNGMSAPPLWATMRDTAVGVLAHELQHAQDDIDGMNPWIPSHVDYTNKNAIRTGNIVMMSIIDLASKHYRIGETKSPWGKWKKEDYLRPWGFAIDEPAPHPPWGSTR